MKFENKVVFIKDENFHNQRYTSPYVYIKSIKKNETYGRKLYEISWIDRFGNNSDINQAPNWVYKNFEIILLDRNPSLIRDFIRFIFKKGR